MKLLTSIALIAILTGCTTLNDKVERMYQINTLNCNGEGFKSYSEFGDNVVAFVCKDGVLGRFEF